MFNHSSSFPWLWYHWCCPAGVCLSASRAVAGIQDDADDSNLRINGMNQTPVPAMPFSEDWLFSLASLEACSTSPGLSLGCEIFELKISSQIRMMICKLLVLARSDGEISVGRSIRSLSCRVQYFLIFFYTERRNSHMATLPQTRSLIF